MTLDVAGGVDVNCGCGLVGEYCSFLASTEMGSAGSWQFKEQ